MPNYLNRVMPFRTRRSYKRRSRSLGTVIQSFKQQTVDGPASRAAATNIVHTIAVGVDNYTGPSALNNEVPTGAKIMSVNVQAAFTNLVSISALLFFTI